MGAGAQNGNLEVARKLYERILQAANKFLHDCKTFSIDDLAMEDPTYDQIAKRIKRVAEVVLLLSEDFDPMMGQKAQEYCALMLNMGVAIANKDVELLSKLVTEMEQKPGV